MRRDVFASMNAIAGWADDLAHVEPNTIKSFSGKLAAIARTGNWNTTGLGLIPCLGDDLGSPVFIATTGLPFEDGMPVLDVVPIFGDGK